MKSLTLKFLWPLVLICLCSCGNSEVTYRKEIKHASLHIGSLFFQCSIMVGLNDDEDPKAKCEVADAFLKKLNNPPARYKEAYSLLLEDYGMAQRLYRASYQSETITKAEHNLLDARHSEIESRLKILLD